MRFVDPPDSEYGTTEAEYRKLSADIQLALEELDHTLSHHGAMVVILSCEKGILSMEIWITNK